MSMNIDDVIGKVERLEGRLFLVPSEKDRPFSHLRKLRLINDDLRAMILNNDEFAAILTQAKADRETVLKLPSTADGVPIVPGMEIHFINEYGKVAAAVVGRVDGKEPSIGAWTEMHGGGRILEWLFSGKVYPTRAAALAALASTGASNAK